MSIPHIRVMTTFRLQPLVLALGLAVAPLLSQAYCDDDTSQAASATGTAPVTDLIPLNPAERRDAALQMAGREQLAELLRTAVAASADARGAEHGLTAAQYDLEQTRAGKTPQVGVSANAGRSRYTQYGKGQYDPADVNGVSLNVSGPLYDGGRIDELTRYRERLLDASGAGLGSTRERVVRDALAAVLERNRYALQLKVHQQHVAKLSCLSRSIDQIVAADPGRASEQVQARSGVRQAEIARDEIQAALRQAEAKLQRIFDSKVGPWTAVGLPLLDLPDLETVLTQVENSPEVRQLRQQADAMRHLARASAAEQSPQVRWQAGLNSSRQATHLTTQSWSVGATVNYTLSDGGSGDAAVGAAQERAEAARRAWENAVNERTKAALVYHDTAASAFQRAGRYVDLLKDSDTLRNATYVQWIKLGRRSLFDLISTENEHHQIRLAYVNAMHDGYMATAQLRNAGEGLLSWAAPDLATPAAPR
jgi:adhesin transport system outer membrane protein